jgi:tRNA(fMet)-specific endonuclease VapC
MKPMLIDTDILSRFFRNDANVVARFQEYEHAHGCINISIITYYEILSGLSHRDAHKQLERFQAFAAVNSILPLSQEAATHAARLYAETRKKGTPVDDIDILIAGIALAHDMGVVTMNTDHFDKLISVHIENWAKALP